jgi:hypothetical protein
VNVADIGESFLALESVFASEGLPLPPEFVTMDTPGGIPGNGAIGGYAPTPSPDLPAQ